MNKTALSKNHLRQAERHLSQTDPIMAKLISDHAPCLIVDREYNPFNSLTNSIISQQLSSKAADTIKRRISEIVPVPFAPHKFLDISAEALRKAGLSAAKTRYILELATRVVDGRLDFNALHEQDDEAAIDTLTQLPGVGRWTAEMFLIFALKRPNIMAFGDAGLHRAAKLLYGKNGLSKTLTQKWHPYCSVASWYLWQHVDNMTKRK